MAPIVRGRGPVKQTIVRGGALPDEVRAALHVGEDDEVAFVDTGRGIVVVPADQAWYWTPEWQEGEREADADLAAGRTRVFQSDEEFLASLEDAINDPSRL
jgi:antitoxin PrlF